MNTRLCHIFLAAILLSGSVPVFPQGATVTATVDRTRVGLNEEFILSVEITGRDSGEPRLPAMESFAALAGTSSSQSFQFVNGRMSASKTIHYTFITQAVGKFEVGAVEVETSEGLRRSQPIQIEIVQSSGGQQQQQQRRGQPQTPGAASPEQGLAASELEGALFLRAEVNRKRVFQNEPVIISYKIYTMRNISSYGISKAPTFAGFWAEDLAMPRQPQTRNEVINGQRFLVAEIKRTALFPQTPGKNVLEPMAIQCDVQIPARRRPRDIFESFFNDPFLSRTVRQEVASKPIEIEVMPLPEAGKPDNFDGAVGAFALQASVDKRHVRANEAITLKVVITGQGNIKTLQSPKIVLPPDFEVYDPKVAESVRNDNNVIAGSKTWEYVVVPRYAGSHEISGLSMAYFDPSAHTYRTALVPAITIEVEKGDSEVLVASGGVSKEDVRLLGQDIRFIAMANAPLRKIGAMQFTSVWFVTLSVLPMFAFAGALFYRRHQEKLSSNVAYARNRRATGVANRQLQTARKFLGSNDDKGFYAEVQRALLGFLGNKLNVAEASLVTEDIADLLKDRNVATDLIDSYLDCLRTCDFQRFAPAATNGVEMKSFYDKAKKAIEEMEEAL